MATHIVNYDLPNGSLGRTNAKFEVFTDDLKTGTLLISKGSIEWKPNSAKEGYCLKWKQFDKAIKQFKNGQV